MQKWEYCVFTGINEKLSGLSAHEQNLFLATSETRVMDEDFRKEANQVFASKQDGFGPTKLAFKRLAHLGEEGWELVAVVGSNFWFKRPKA